MPYALMPDPSSWQMDPMSVQLTDLPPEDMAAFYKSMPLMLPPVWPPMPPHMYDPYGSMLEAEQHLRLLSEWPVA
jgi:hypothetical protein